MEEKRDNIKEESEEEHENNVVTGSVIHTPGVKEMQQLMHSHANSSGGWQKCWELGVTPWDLGHPTPIVVHLIQSDALPKGRVLVPGCGAGHDVVAMASPDRQVVGLDLSDVAINKAEELSSSSPNAKQVSFLKEDFFTWCPSSDDDLFDLIFDYTFFCAIVPEKRAAWAQKLKYLLKPDGELITLMFPISDHAGGPPYKASISDYEEVLHPLGFQATSIVDNQLAIQSRKGLEKLGRWKRSVIKPPMA